MWYWLFKHVLIGPVLRFVGRPTIEGAEHIPRRGPVILAANHLAFVDSMYLCLLVKRPVAFVAKNEFFVAPGLKGRVLRWFFRAAGQVPIDRAGGRAAQTALAAATSILESGGIWGIHPEGTRSRDGRLYRGKTGTMRVALATGAPVVPVVISGTETINPIGTRVLRFGKVHLTVCEPLDLSAYLNRPINQPLVREATDHLMRTLQQHSAQPYVDDYADRQAS